MFQQKLSRAEMGESPDLLLLLLLLRCFFVHGGLELTLIHSSYRLLVSSIGLMKFKPTMRMDGTI